MNKMEIIEDAIEKKKQLTFVYNGADREISPHKMGIKFPKDGVGAGDTRVFGMQFGGHDHEGNPVEGKWRCFSIEGVTDLQSGVGDGVFYTEETLGGPNFCMTEVTKEVKID